MKGIVFTEFIEFVEENISEEVADEIIESSELKSGGIYTSVGTYDYEELVQLVTNLSKAIEKPIPDLLKVFGKHLFHRFLASFPQFFSENLNLTDFLESVEKYIHVEVRKLYPDAELPTFECEFENEKFLMTYHSKRDLADFAEGLIESTIEHYGESYSISREKIEIQDETCVRFILKKQE